MIKVLKSFCKLVFALSLNWGVTVGFIKLITMCFDVEFSLRIATGIWLIIWFIKWVLNPGIEA